MTEHEESTQQIRAKVQQVLDRAKDNPDYLESFKSDPQGTLKAAGLSDAAAAYVSTEELRPGGEVAGFMLCQNTCDRWTCVASFCGKIPLTN